ncbi:DUF484 family protein [Frateuria aurantia]
MADSLTPLQIPAAAVAEYLEQHLDFLADYPELAQRLRLPREQDGAASLVAYQLQALRERNQSLQQQLTELTQIAADNEDLMERVQRLTLAVFEARALDVGLGRLVARLGEDFQVEQLKLWLFGEFPQLGTHEWLRSGAEATTPPTGVAELLAAGEPWSGRLAPERLAELFGPTGSRLRSVALLPLGQIGVLALGSENADRFQPGMGTIFLGMIAAAVTVALNRDWLDA